MGKKSKDKSAPVSDRQAKIDAAAKANKPGPNKILIATVVALVAIAAIVFGVIVAEQSNRGSTTTAAGQLPAGVTGAADGFEATSAANVAANAPTLEIYEDFRCPACHRAYAVFHDTITQMAEQGQVKVVYHFKTVIDSQDRNSYSLEAAAAALCAADDGRFNEFHDAILDDIVASGQQPNWGPALYSSIAERAGITGEALTAFDSCVANGTYEGYVANSDAESASRGINSTPQYFLNGELLDFNVINTPELLVQAIENATGE